MTEEKLPYHERLKKIKLGLAAKEAVAKPKKYLNKISPKRAAEIQQQRNAGDSKLDLWFEERRLEMSGRCALCGGKTEKKSDETYRRSIHHILDKRKTMFPSLATRPENFLEVCFYGNSCHQNIHNGTISWELLHSSKEWDIIKPKLEILLPLCTIEERKNKLYDKLIKLVYEKQC